MINKITLIGNAGKDAVLKSAGAEQYALFTLATNDRYQDAHGVWQTSTEWHTVKIWGRSADIAARRIKKGVMIYVEGKLKSYEYEGRTLWEVKAILWRALDKAENDDEYQPSSKLLGPEPVIEPKTSPWGYPIK
tara:strand:- start:39 stop:440 length:402 start_codon:yes stop_codon:yes gene_type:complete